MTDIETKNIILPPNGSFLSGNLTLSNYEQILERENSNLKNRIKELEDKLSKLGTPETKESMFYFKSPKSYNVVGLVKSKVLENYLTIENESYYQSGGIFSKVDNYTIIVKGNSKNIDSFNNWVKSLPGSPK